MKCILCLVVFLGTALAADDSAQLVGTVVSTRGIWCDEAYQNCRSENFRSIWRMYPVRRNSRLTRLPPLTGQESVMIRSRSGSLEVFDCSKARELGCRAPLDLTRLVPTEPVVRTVVTAFMDAVMQLASERPVIYDNIRQGILRSPGTNRPVLRDGVARLAGDKLALEGVLRDAAPGDFLLELCPTDESSQPRCPDQARPVQYRWTPGHAISYRDASLAPGLYRLYLCDASTGIALRTATYAVLLSATEPRYSRLAAQFDEVDQATRTWDTTDLTAPRLRRVYLHTLAAQ